MKKNGFYLLTIALFVSGLSACEPAQQIESEAEIRTALQKPDVQFSIYSDSYRSNSSRHVQVNLPERITEDELEKIGNYLKSIERKDQSHNRTYIFYYVADQSREIAWATSHFDPEIEVRIIGASEDEYAELSKEESTGITIEGEVIGQWIANRGISYRLILHKTEDTTHYITSIYSDGSFGKDEVKVTEIPIGTKLQSERGESFDEYFVIERSGRLQFWGEGEKYYTAPVMN